MVPRANSSPKLEEFRSYLLLLARLHLDGRERTRVEASDVVQQTLMEAHVHVEKLPKRSDQLAAWLRMALANNIRDARKFLRRQRRDVTRERQLASQLSESSQQFIAGLAALSSSPSHKAMRQEELLRVADALWALPESQREAVVLHHLQGWTLSQIANKLNKSDAAVAGLLHRGLRNLRERLNPKSIEPQ